MVRKLFLLICISVFLLISILGNISAWEFNGTIRDINGNLLNNTLVNITFWIMGGPTGMSYVGTNSTYSFDNGTFSLTVTENSSWMYKPVITHTNETTGSIDWIGQSLPTFPYQEFADLNNISFYLREAGTINITAIYANNTARTFQYIIKDTALGYSIAEGFGTYVSEAVVYVPRDRNYSIQIFPNQGMPVTYNWNNFSSLTNLNISTPSNGYNLSNYTVANHTLKKKFNCSESLIWVNGYALNSTGGIDDYNEFTVIPLLLEGGNMVYLGDNAGMPYNMSAWRLNSTPPGFQVWTDKYNLTSGFYNITLPGPAESITYILFATARNGTNYYGGYRNISLNYTSESTSVNFTMYPLMSTDWNSSVSNFTMKNAGNWQNLNISSAKMQFNLVNSTTNATLSQTQAHIEATVDYSNCNATEFTFMMDVAQTGAASFYLPLINCTSAIGVKEMNIYSQSFAPKTVLTRTPAQLIANSNISMSTFNPGKIDGSNIKSSVSVKMYKSNSTCNMPNPADSCIIADSANMNAFNPLSSIIGGGKINFVMGLLSSGIIVEYINVDMLASGPPDAAFDTAATETTSGDFDSAMRFGSNGPTIYEYVLISMPYTEGNTSTTGLNENADVNMSIPVFYDENWNIIWNATNNGTSGANLAGNQSHYSTYATQWETLMEDNNCTRDKSELNSTKPCYIDTTNNRIWIRLPHFSGTQPSVTGSVVTATASPSTNNPGGGGTVSSPNEWSEQKIQSWTKMTPGNVTIMKYFDKDIGIKEIWIEVDNPAQDVKITVRKYDNKPANVSVNKTGKVYQYLQINAQNLEDNLKNVKLNIRINKTWVEENNLSKEDIVLFKFDDVENKWNNLTTIYLAEENETYYYVVELNSFSYFAIAEKSLVSGEDLNQNTNETATNGEEEEELAKGLGWWWVAIVAGIIIVIYLIYITFFKKQ